MNLTLPFNYPVVYHWPNSSDNDEYISRSYVEKQKSCKQGNAEGYACISCNEFYPMVELNFPENSNEFLFFKCFSCRKGLHSIFLNKIDNYEK